jgi:TonB family protein
MKYFSPLRLLAFCIIFSFPHLGFSQKDLTNGPHYEVNKVYPYISITKEEMNEAERLIDLNRHYPASWVKEYVSVEVTANHQGKSKKAASKNDLLTTDQKAIMSSSDIGAEISVRVQYFPDNELKHNEIKELNFSFVLQPEKDAGFVGGKARLLQYLKEKAIDQIPETVFTGYDLAALKFTITAEGAVTNAFIIESSRNDEVDALLLKTIRNMPCWKPAEYAGGEKVSQDLVLTVGNMENCIVNTLSIGRGVADQ